MMSRIRTDFKKEGIIIRFLHGFIRNQANIFFHWNTLLKGYFKSNFSKV